MSNTVQYYSPTLFLTENAVEKELYQKIVEMLDYTEGRSDDADGTDFETVAQSYNAIVNKYKDIFSLNEQSLRSMMSEAGETYESMINVAQMNNVQLAMFVQYLPIIKFLKGSRTGLEVVLDLFCSEYTLTEWFEDPSHEMPDYTFRIDLMRILDYSITSDIANNVIEFCRHYLYPVLTYVAIGLLFKYDNIFWHCYPISQQKIIMRVLEEL